jgi:D-alanine-D-alanine ligase-like ATP-grasp enzyme
MQHDRIVLVEKAVVGRDYRLVVFDGELVAAYERIPLTITGDGSSTIKKLIENVKKTFKKSLKEDVIDESDFRIFGNLNRLNLNLDSKLEQGKKIVLFDNANLSTGGTSRDVTENVHIDFKKLVSNIANDMGLRLVGVDLIVNGCLSESPKANNYWVLELNSAPGLDHFATLGDKQKTIVEELYLKVVIEMEREKEAIVKYSACQ